ncbi:MAG TPA: phage/plasmid primase, P4 family, partial [Gemmatirosa sp.]
GSAAKTVAAVERLAKADRAHAAVPEQWDADPMLLNTPGGTVDLRTGALRLHRRGDYCTKSTAVTPGGEAPQWDAFLAWATGGDDELYAFLRRMFGYCLTGVTTEHALFFHHGGGGNGKGTALNTVSFCLGDYAKTSPMETFTASHGERHPTELAMLRGARLVTAQETEEGRRWAESRIKALTGGDPITARFMRSDFFTFQPEFKLVIAGNHRPQLRNVDAAWRRRFHLIPWTQHVAGTAVNHALGDELRAEAPGVLAWMVQGCQEWLEYGLRPPAIVQDATAEYREAEDTFARWLDDCCVRRPGQWASSAELFGSWSQWAERLGERPGNAKTFAGAMQSHGLVPQTTGKAKTRGYAGVTLKPSMYPAVARAS